MDQLLMSKDRILIKYLKVYIISRTWSRDYNSALAATWAEAAYRWWCFCYASFLHIAVTRYLATIESRGINMSHCLH